MKKIVSMLFVLMLVFCMAACGGAGSEIDSFKESDLPAVGSSKAEIKGDSVLYTVNAGFGSYTVQEYIFEKDKLTGCKMIIGSPSKMIAKALYDEMMSEGFEDEGYTKVELDGDKLICTLSLEEYESFAEFTKEDLLAVLNGDYSTMMNMFGDMEDDYSDDSDDYNDSDDYSNSDDGSGDYSDLFGGYGDLTGDTDYSAADINALIAEAAEQEGLDVIYGEDGSITYKDENGETVTMNPDGSFSYEDESGMMGQVGSTWPDNEFTKLIPKPEFGTLLVATTDNGVFASSFTGGTMEDVKAYAQKVKKAGFDKDVDEYDSTEWGMTVYSFSAESKAGYYVSVTYTDWGSSVTLEKLQ